MKIFLKIVKLNHISFLIKNNSSYKFIIKYAKIICIGRHKMSGNKICSMLLSQQRLLEIINFQTDVVKIGPDLGSIMTLITHKAQEMTHAKGATLELAEGEDMVYRATSGSLEPFLGLHLKKDSSLSGLCVKTGEIFYSENTQADDRVDKEASSKVGALSMVVVPLKHDEDTVGVLKIVSDKTSFFSDHDICVLSIVGDIMASLMYYAARYATDELFYKASHDALTELNNRSAFYDQLFQLTALSKQKTINFAIAIIDMDGLKYINDMYGHKAGDEAIKEFAKRLKNASRDVDIVARLGGDEFGLILKNITHKHEIDLVINRISKEIDQDLLFEDYTLQIGGSIGYALFPEDSQDLHKLIEIADYAMYTQKRLRKALKE